MIVNEFAEGQAPITSNPAKNNPKTALKAPSALKFTFPYGEEIGRVDLAIYY